MIELGKIQTLVVQREKEFGVYLGESRTDEHSVLLPKKQVPARHPDREIPWRFLSTRIPRTV